MPSFIYHPTILVAAEPTLYREGLIALLKQQWPASAIILTTDTGQVIELIRTRAVHLLILDGHLPGRALPTFLHHLRQARSTQKIALLTDDNQITSTNTLFQVSISRHSAPSHLAATIAPLLASTCYNTLLRKSHPVPTHFSSRELEVLRLAADDHCNQEIADQLYLSVRTVESHRRALLQKSGSRTLTGLVAWALRAGIVA